MVDWSDLSELINNGITLREIARRKECSHSSVRKAIAKYKISYTADRSAIGKKLYCENKYIRDNLKTLNKKRLKFKCAFCGKDVFKLHSQVKGYNNTFCSMSCRAKHNGQKLKHNIDYKKSQRDIAIANGSKPPLLIGENHWNWKGGISPKNGRETEKYRQWRISVLKKFNYTCQVCFVRGGRLSAHHIKEWALFPDLRYDVDNGTCLCYTHHMELHGLNKKTA